MQRRQQIKGHESERGIVVLIVAMVLLFIVAAMAALAIDLVTFYTARSEAQLAADAAALAGARSLANSGMTSDPNATLISSAEIQATTIAKQVGQHNDVGGRNFVASEVQVTFNDTQSTFGTNPHITVKVTRTDLPTFFAHIWGRTQIAVTATATAEAYNPSGANASVGHTAPVAPICVKPWVLPNLKSTGAKIFDPTTGAIQTPNPLNTAHTLQSNCQSGCTPVAWNFYPGAPASFPAPAQAQSHPACSTGFSNYQLSIAGCIQKAIACGDSVTLNLAGANNQQTADAVNCLTHSSNNKGDTIGHSPPEAFQFDGGLDSPIPNARGTDILVSDSLATLPVIDETAGPLTAPVQVIGFVQLFLNRDGTATPATGQIDVTVVNLAGCGTGASGQPILGNGASPVAVRLIAPQ